MLATYKKKTKQPAYKTRGRQIAIKQDELIPVVTS